MVIVELDMLESVLFPTNDGVRGGIASSFLLDSKSGFLSLDINGENVFSQDLSGLTPGTPVSQSLTASDGTPITIDISKDVPGQGATSFLTVGNGVSKLIKSRFVSTH